MNRKRILRHVLGAATCAIMGLALTAPTASAAFGFGPLTVTQDGKTAGYGRGNISVFATSATINASAKAGNYKGQGVYVMGYASGRSTGVPLRSKNTTSKTYQNVSAKKTYHGSTAGPWSGQAKVCVDIAYWFDPCGNVVTGRI